MRLELSQQFTFEAAHTLTRSVPVADFTASKRIHGHTYFAEVGICGEPTASGMLGVPKLVGKRTKVVPVDLFDLREAIEKVRLQLDHRFLDDVDGLGPATLENLAQFIANAMPLPLAWVCVWRQTGDKCRLILGAE